MTSEHEEGGNVWWWEHELYWIMTNGVFLLLSIFVKMNAVGINPQTPTFVGCGIPTKTWLGYKNWSKNMSGSDSAGVNAMVPGRKCEPRTQLKPILLDTLKPTGKAKQPYSCQIRQVHRGRDARAWLQHCNRGRNGMGPERNAPCFVLFIWGSDLSFFVVFAQLLVDLDPGHDGGSAIQSDDVQQPDRWDCPSVAWGKSKIYTEKWARDPPYLWLIVIFLEKDSIIAYIYIESEILYNQYLFAYI